LADKAKEPACAITDFQYKIATLGYCFRRKKCVGLRDFQNYLKFDRSLAPEMFGASALGFHTSPSLLIFVELSE